MDSIEQWKEKIQQAEPPKSAEPPKASSTAGAGGASDSRSGGGVRNRRAQGLGDILKVDMLDSVPTNILVKMWAEHHGTKQLYVSGVLEAPVFKTFRDRAREFSRVSGLFVWSSCGGFLV